VPPAASAFEAATALTPAGDSSYDVTINPGWSIASVPNGGYLLAMLARAALDVTKRDDPLAISGHFLRPLVAGPARITVEPLKSGRRVASARASLHQGGKLHLDSLVTTGALPEASDDGPEWSDRTMPQMPEPAACIRNDRGPFDVALMEQVEERIDPATLPFGRDGDGRLTTAPNGRPAIRAWIRLADGAPPDSVFLTLGVDALPPPVFNLGHFGWAPTVELTALIRRRPADGWLLCETSASVVGHGWFDEQATIWDSTGHVVAQSRQLALVGAG